MNVTAWFAKRQRMLVSLAVIAVLLALFGKNVPIWGGCTAALDRCADVVAIGVFQGMIVALVALGYTLVYGILQLINFANGSVFMLGSVFALLGVEFFGLTSDSPGQTVILAFAVILPVTMLITAGLNVGIERVAYRPLRRAPTLATLISAIGVDFILQNVGQVMIGPSPVSLPSLLPTTTVISEPFVVKVSHLFVTAITVPLLLGLTWFVRTTRQGKAMRATAQDREAAGLMGIDVNRTISLTFLLAGALAGGAGVVVALYNGSAWWQYGFSYGLLAFTAAVFGGIGNLLGAAVGGVVLGVLISLNAFYIDPRWQEIVVFGVLVLVLVFRPTGLFGAKQSERA